MIAFEISINGELTCIAGFPEHHMLFATLMYTSKEDAESFSLNVQGSDLKIFENLNFTPEQDQKEKLLVLVERIKKHGYQIKEWVNEELPRELNMDIRIVEVEPELLSESTEKTKDIKDLGGIMSKYLG